MEPGEPRVRAVRDLPTAVSGTRVTGVLENGFLRRSVRRDDVRKQLISPSGFREWIFDASRKAPVIPFPVMTDLLTSFRVLTELRESISEECGKASVRSLSKLCASAGCATVRLIGGRNGTIYGIRVGCDGGGSSAYPSATSISRNSRSK